MTEKKWMPGACLRGGKLAALGGALVMLGLARADEEPVSGNWTTTANGNWGDVSNWDNSIIPNGVGHIAWFNNNVNATRTITNNLGNITLGQINFANTNAGDFGYTIQTGTITFDNDGAPAVINVINSGGSSSTINSDMHIVDRLDINVLLGRNSRGLTLGTTGAAGVISGGTTGETTIRINAPGADDFANWVIIRGNNNFAGQILVESGHLRLETRATAAGLRGVGNEVIVTGTGRVDLRGVNHAVQADDTQIFMIEGAGPNGLGALVNTTSTSQLSHLILTGDATIGGQSTTILNRRLNQAGNADIAGILDLGENNLTKLGAGTTIIRNAEWLNTAGSTVNIHEGILRLDNFGALTGGDPQDYGNDITGLTFNIRHVPGAYDGVDPLNGSRTSDPFSPNRAASDVAGNAVVGARLSFRTDWATGSTLPANTHVTESRDNVTFNIHNGVFQREGSTSAGQTFDHIFETGAVFNLTGGTMGQNIFTMAGGSGGFNAAINAYDHPGVTEIRGPIDNSSPGNEGEGFTKRGNRELRLTNANANFTGDVLVKQNTARWMPGNYSNATGAHESQYFSLSLAGEDGSLNQASSIELTRWGSLALLNSDTEGAHNRGGFSSVNNNNRLNSNGMLNFRNGILYLETHSTDANTENIGHVTADLGTNFFFIDTRAGGSFDGAMASFNSNNGGVLKITSMNPEHGWGAGAGEVSLRVLDSSGISTVGAVNPGNPDQRVVQNMFATIIPEFAERTGAAETRSDYTMQQAAGLLGVGMGLMTLENVGGVDFLRPLTADEYHFGATPLAGTNWVLNQFIQPEDGPFGYGDRRNYAERQITSDIAVNSLTIAWDALASGQDMLNTERDYLIIEQGSTLAINSGIINFATLAEVDASANATAGIRGGQLDMNGQAAIINSALTRHVTNSTSGTSTTFLAGNNAFMRSPMVNVTDLIKTGRNNLYLDVWNDLTGNIYVSEQGGLFVRHPGALGAGAPGREVQVGGAGNFYLEYGSNISGIDLRVTNSFDTTRTALAGIGATHNTWGGDIIFDTADSAGSTEFQNHIITARNNGTLSIRGNIYTANNENFSDNTSFNQPALMSTAVGESATINLFGQVRDTADGPLLNVGDTGDSETRLSRAHSMAFQMRGHNEINVTAHQQWNATGAIFATQGYFRIAYDPHADGLDGTGFQTDSARAAITQVNTWNDMWLGGLQNSLGVSNSATNAYHGHIMLTRPDQVLNWGDRIQVSNNNRNHTLTLGGEHHSGTAYIGSADNSRNYTIFFQNSNTERDLRFLQAAGGTLVVNARLQDGNSTANSFNSSVSMVGPGTVVFNRNGAGSSTVDRWNFMAGTAVWDNMTGNNQFARSWGSGSEIGGVSGWGGGNLVLAEQGAARSQQLNGGIFMMGGASSITVNQNTTMTVGNAARPFSRSSSATIAFFENGNGAINFSGVGLPAATGDFVAPWAVYGSTAGGITDWAGRQGAAGVQAFTAYTDDVFEAGAHTNLTLPATLAESAATGTLRFGGAFNLDLGGNSLTLERGGLLIPASVLENLTIGNGALTSGWADGGRDLLVYNFGQGLTTLDAVISNDGAEKINLVFAGDGTTVLTQDNTHTGHVYLNNGVVKISRDEQLGTVNGAIDRVVLVGPGGSYSSGASGVPVVFEGGDGDGASATFNTVSSTTASARVVNRIDLVDGGGGYTSGVRVRLEDGTGSNAGAWAILDSGNLHFDGGVLHATDSFALNSGRTIFLGGNGGTLRVDPGKTLTIDGFISGEYNHVHGGNGYNQSNSLGNPWDASSVRNPDIGDLTIDGGGTVVFRYSPLGDGSTPGNLAHAYGGTTWINDGVLRLAGVGTTGVTGALGTHNSFIDGTVIGANGSLDFHFASSDPTIFEWFILRGQGYQGGGTFTSTVPHGSRVYNLGGQISVDEDAVFNIRNGREFRVNSGGGDMFGEGSITRVGNGTLRFRGNNPDWTGDLNLVSGTNIIDSVGSLGGMGSLTLQRNSYLSVSAAETSVSGFRDRLPDNLPIYSNGWTRLRMDATSGVHSGLEKAGTVTVQAGVMGIEFNLGSDIVDFTPRLTGDWAGWHFDEIIRVPGSSVAVRNLDAGTAIAGGNFGQVPGNMQNQALLLVNTAPDTVGGDGSNFNHAIAPGFFGGTRDLWSQTGTNNLFLENRSARSLMVAEQGAHPETGAPVFYIRPLDLSEYRVIESVPSSLNDQTDSVALDGLGLTGQNVNFIGRAGDGIGEVFTARRNSMLTLGGDESVNSISFTGEVYSGNTNGWGNTTTLTIADHATLTIESGVIHMAQLGIMDRGGVAQNTDRRPDSRAFFQGGTLDFNGREIILHNASMWIQYNSSDAPDAFAGAARTENTQLTISSVLANNGGLGLTKTGPSEVWLQVANQYSGPTNVIDGILRARHPQALGFSEIVNITGAGNFYVGMGSEISGVDVHVGLINGNNIVLGGEQGSSWGGNVIIDNVDIAGATSYTRLFTPRVANLGSYLFTMDGDIFGGDTPINDAIRATESRMFSTQTGGRGIFDIKGRVMDNAGGVIGAPVTEANQNQVLRMQVSASNDFGSVQLWQPHESAGRIHIARGTLRYMGEGSFYSDAAAAAINPDNPMSGFQMGGRTTLSSDGTGAHNLAFMLGRAGQVFNLSSWDVGVDRTDPDNAAGHDNFSRGNTSGNITLGGENRSGVVTFGTGTGAITFTNNPRDGGYNGDLRLLAFPGGQVDLRAALLDEGDEVDSSITKVGAGTVRLLGSSIGDSTVEGVNVMGGFLTMTGYNENANRRVGENAALLMGGGALVLDAGAVAGVEDFGDVTVAGGGSALVAAGPFAVVNLNGGWTTGTGGALHFQSIAGGSIHLGGVPASTRLGSWATFGSSLDAQPNATSWAATDVVGQVTAFTDFAINDFTPGTHADLTMPGQIAGETETLRFNTNDGSITGGVLVLNEGGILLTSNYGEGTPIGAGVQVQTGDLMLHNFAFGEVIIAGDITAGTAHFNGTGRTVLTGSNTITGDTFITGATTLAVSGLEQIGAGGLYLNGGVLELLSQGGELLWDRPLTLGGNDGTIRLVDPDSRMIIRGAATNLISSEANPVAGITTNPYSGGLVLEGAGTFQFGERSAANNAQDILGINNAYTGLTVIGDGVNPTRVEIQGQVNNNGQISPFGTTGSWADGTLVRNNATLEFGVRRGDGSRNGQVRVREWFEWGETADDVVGILVGTQREVALDGFHRINGTLEITMQNQGYGDAGGNGQTTLYFGLNEGGVYGDGRIVINPEPNNSNSYGTVQIRDPLVNFTGDIEVRNGYLVFYGLGATQGVGTSPIILGTEGASNGHRVDLRLFSENGTNGSNTVQPFDSPPTDLVLYRDIRIADNTNQDVRLYSGYYPASGFARWTGNIDVGNTPDGTFRMYYEDTENRNPVFMGTQQHVVMAFSGDISGNRRLLLDANEGGSNNETQIDGGAKQHRAIFTTFMLSGDNSGFQGDVRVSNETGSTFDKDDIPILRFGSDTALTAQNDVIMQNLSAIQVGGANVTIGNLSTNGGNSTSGLYSFTNQDWAPGRNSLYDLDHTGAGNALAIISGSSEIIENASAQPGTLTITQNVFAEWDAYFRDGRQDALIDGSIQPAASLSLVKAGDERAVLTIFNDYTGTTTVAAGNLQVGSAGTGEWGSLTQGDRTEWSALSGATMLAGSTGTGLTLVQDGATLSGSGHVRGGLTVNAGGILSPGDNGGLMTGTLFIGDGSGGTLTLNSNAVMELQLAGTAHVNASLQSGTVNWLDEDAYNAFFANVANLLGAPAVDNPLNPALFGGADSHINVGTHDHLEIGGDLVWNGGTITVSPAFGWTPAPGQIYNLMDWFGDASWGSFNPGSQRLLIGNGDDDGDLVLPDLSIHDPNLRWDTSLFESHGVLVISAPFDVSGPPVILGQPQSQTVFAQQQVTFSVDAVGPGTLNFVWKRNGEPILDAPNLPFLTIPSVPVSDIGQTIAISVDVSNEFDTTPSEIALLVVGAPIVITQQPQPVEAQEGNVVVFSVSAEGDEPFDFQWFLNGMSIPDSNTPALSVTASLATAGFYQVRVSNSYAELDSATVELSLLPPDIDIIEQPESQILPVGETLTLSIEAEGGRPKNYQWLLNNRPIPGANEPTLEVSELRVNQAGVYRCRVSNNLALGRDTQFSDPAVVAVVNTNPVNYARPEPGAQRLTVQARGHASDPITYRWFRNEGTTEAPNWVDTEVTTANYMVRDLNAGKHEFYCKVTTLSGLEIDGGVNTVRVFNDEPELALNEGDALPGTTVSFDYRFQVPLVEGDVAGEPDATRMPTHFAAAGLPRGLRINNEGLIFGRPQVARFERGTTNVIDFDVVITARNARGRSVVGVKLRVEPLGDNLIGQFTGPVDPHPDLNANLGGLLNITVNPRGAFTGTVALGRATHRVRGVLDPEAGAAKGIAPVPRGRLLPPLELTFHLNAAGRIDRALSSLTDGDQIVQFDGWRNPWRPNRNDPQPAAEFAGYYTMQIGPTPPADLGGHPQGMGFMTYTVNPRTGRLNMNGRLADNAPFTCATFVSEAGDIAIYRSLYPVRGPGSILGSMVVNKDQVVDPTAVPELKGHAQGLVRWVRGALATAPLYPLGFELANLPVEGTRYVRPFAQVIDIPATNPGEANALVELRGADIEGAFPPVAGPEAETTAFRVDERNRVQLVGENPRNVTLAINAQRGLFNGRFRLQGFSIEARLVTRNTAYQGVLVRTMDENGDFAAVGVGLFILNQMPGSPFRQLGGLALLYPYNAPAE